MICQHHFLGECSHRNCPNAKEHECSGMKHVVLRIRKLLLLLVKTYDFFCFFVYSNYSKNMSSSKRKQTCEIVHPSYLNANDSIIRIINLVFHISEDGSEIQIIFWQ